MSDIDALALIRQEATAATLPQKPIRVLGIDLGTTNSTVAELRWTPEEGLTQEARCLEVDQQTYEGLYTHVLVPSVVAIHNGKVFVGEGAKRLRARAPELGLRQNQDLFSNARTTSAFRRRITVPLKDFGRWLRLVVRYWSSCTTLLWNTTPHRCSGW